MQHSILDLFRGFFQLTAPKGGGISQSVRLAAKFKEPISHHKLAALASHRNDLGFAANLLSWHSASVLSPPRWEL